jgi:bile acid-coenzyme A ligase
MSESVSYGRRLTQLAAERGEADALVFAADDGTDRPISWRTLERRANQAARLLAARGAQPGDTVVVALDNSPEHLAATFGAWKLGASVLPLRGDLPAWERERLLEVARPAVVVGDWADAAGPVVTPDDIRSSVSLDNAPLAEDHIPPYTRLLATSGSTGTPKIIVTPSPGVYVEPEGMAAAVSGDADLRTLCVSPLYHNNGFAYCYPPLLQGKFVVLMGHFDAARAVGLIETYRITMTVLVPTMLQRIARLDDVHSRDLSSIERVIYGGASLPEWVARTWLELIPPERFMFVYGGSELLGATMCTGREWLDHPGTVGVPVGCDVAILDDDLRELPVGEVGQIWMRLHTDAQPFNYIGTDTPEPILDGFRSFGDMGRLDDEGYLYIADRRQDMIVTGGVNVFPAEVEAALSEHPAVADVVVIGVPDPEWGHRIHAIVQPVDMTTPPTDTELREHCRARLSGPKVPKSLEMTDRMPRTSAGKVNRSRLSEERTTRP